MKEKETKTNEKQAEA